MTFHVAILVTDLVSRDLHAAQSQQHLAMSIPAALWHRMTTGAPQRLTTHVTARHIRLQRSENGEGKILLTVCSERWEEAHAQREELMGSITRWSGVGTLEDFRRYRDYDADKLVDQYLNQPAVKVRGRLAGHVGGVSAGSR